MFFLFAKKLIEQEIVEEIEKMRSSRGREQDKAFINLRDTFQPMLLKEFSTVKRVADNYQEQQDIKHYITTVFSEALLSPGLGRALPDLNHTKAYLKTFVLQKVNVDTVRDFLGKTPIIKDIHRLEWQFKNALKRYYEKFNRQPDLEDEKDLEQFSKILGKDEKEVLESLRVIGKGTIKSLYQSIAGDDEGNMELLIDALQSDKPLPDEVYKDKEVLKTFMNEIQRYLSPEERNVFMMYYHPDNPGGANFKKEELADVLNLPFRKIKHLLWSGKAKLQRSPKLKELYYAELNKKFVRLAILTYRFNKKVSRYERIISEVLLNA